MSMGPMQVMWARALLAWTGSRETLRLWLPGVGYDISAPLVGTMPLAHSLRPLIPNIAQPEYSVVRYGHPDPSLPQLMLIYNVPRHAPHDLYVVLYHGRAAEAAIAPQRNLPFPKPPGRCSLLP